MPIAVEVVEVAVDRREVAEALIVVEPVVATFGKEPVPPVHLPAVGVPRHLTN